MKLPQRLMLGCAAMVVLLAGCGSEPTTTEEGLLRAAFQAIRNENAEAFAKLTITRADFLLKENKVGVFKAKQSFAGGVLRPEERRAQSDAFRRAVRGGKGLIDFRHARFLGAGEVVAEGQLELLSGNPIFVKTYTLAVKSDDPAAATPARGPYFVVTPWKSGYRVLDLRFGDG